MRKNLTTTLSALLLSVLGVTSTTTASQNTPERVGEAYPLSVCSVTGNPLGENPVVVVLKDMPREDLNGREVRFCCGGCKTKFESDPVASNSKLDEMIIADQLTVYPTGSCLVMEDEPMADPRGPEAGRDKNVVIGNRLYRLCCKSCIRRLRKNPSAYQTALDDRIKKQQSASYPLKVCVITGRPYGESPFEVVVANRLVRTCCGGCAAGVKKNPELALGKLKATKTNPTLDADKS